MSTNHCPSIYASAGLYPRKYGAMHIKVFRWATISHENFFGQCRRARLERIDFQISFSRTSLSNSRIDCTSLPSQAFETSMTFNPSLSTRSFIVPNSAKSSLCLERLSTSSNTRKCFFLSIRQATDCIPTARFTDNPVLLIKALEIPLRAPPIVLAAACAFIPLSLRCTSAITIRSYRSSAVAIPNMETRTRLYSPFSRYSLSFPSMNRVFPDPQSPSSAIAY